MKKWIIMSGLLASIAMASGLHAQVPDPGAAAGAAGAAGAGAGGKNIWSMFCMTPEQAARCKDKICNSPIGEMLKSAAKPMTLMSGGLLFSKCGTPTQSDLDKLKAEGKEGSAEGEAAKIKKSEAEAAARRQAIRYLGTVDCNWWPDAREALIAGLRTDPNECVRYEAALALLRGCCCNKKIMEALKDSANATDKFGPKENSWRVREAASEALAHCASLVVEEGPAAEQQKKLKEIVPPPPPQAYNKGLIGIFANATTTTPATQRTVQPIVRDAIATTPAPMPQSQPYQTVEQPRKGGLLYRIDWGGSSRSYPVVESSQPSVMHASGTLPSVVPGRPTDEVVPTRGTVTFEPAGSR